MLSLITNAGALYFAGRVMVKRGKRTAETPLDPEQPIGEAVVETLTSSAAATCMVLGILSLTPATGVFGLALLANDAWTHRAKIQRFARSVYTHKPQPQAVRLRSVK
jgi:hypothetical protein